MKIDNGLSEQSFNGMMVTSIISYLLMLVVGIVIYFAADLVNDLIGYLVAGLCILTAFDALYKYIRRHGAKIYSLNILFVLMLLFIGIIILIKPIIVTSFITVSTGLFLIITGSLKISYGLWLKYGSERSWLLTTFIGLMIIMLGLLLFLNPFESSHEITKIIGIFIILSNVLNIVDVLLLKKRSSEIVKVFW